MLPIRRRALLTALGSGLVLPSALLASPSVFAADKVKRDKRPVAVLLPLSGPRAALGLSMRQGVLLADSGPELTAYDTGGTPEGAALAARTADSGAIEQALTSATLRTASSCRFTRPCSCGHTAISS